MKWKWISFALLFAAFAALNLQAFPPVPIVAKTTKIPLQWNPSITPGVTYKLYHSTNNATWDKTYPGISATSYTVTNVPAGSLNWFTVTAVNSDGIESDPSNVVEKPVEAKPAPATGLLAIPIVVQVESTTNDVDWTAFRRYTNNMIVSTSEPERKFRSAVFVGTPAELVTPR